MKTINQQINTGRLILYRYKYSNIYRIRKMTVCMIIEKLQMFCKSYLKTYI